MARKQTSLREIWQLAAGGAIAFAFSFYYLIIFKVGYAREGVGNSIQYQAPEWYDVVISQFGWAQILILIGLAAAFYFLIIKKENPALLFGIFMLAVGYGNFMSSITSRAFQTRYLWPVHLAVFIGLAVYFLLKVLIKEWKIFYSIALSVILASSITYGYYQKNTGSGILDEAHWRHILWVRENTPKDAKILYFYGDPYDQEAILWNLKRVSYRVRMADFANAVRDRKIKREYDIEVAAADDAAYLYRKSFFSFGYHAKEVDETGYGKKDICKFDYFVFDKAGRQQALVAYNALIANELVKNESATGVFDNGAVLILKNGKPGGNCIEERGF